MKNLKSSEIRQMWLDFFKSKGHSVEPSASLIPVKDKTLLWINAGVASLKKYFDGTEKPLNPRITNAQKCIRTNDIENVGKTARHHTFFEMLGNFSIGDYFKDDAVKWAYELLTDPKWFAFDKDKLYMTVYSSDDYAKKLWMDLGIEESHIIPLEGNFWEIGEGPCGPCTEIFYDRGEKFDKRGKELIEQDIENDRFIEIWNIVFSQYNAKEGVKRENYKELPSKNIDTGCGLERLSCVMQEVSTNYDTDLFMPIIQEIEKVSNVKYEGQMAFKVIADHIRTVTFAISDGAILSNEGRGYVLRRVLRRATKYGKKLGIEKPFMYNLVDTVIQIMDSYYPYLHEKRDIVKKIVLKEEQKFLETINNGQLKFQEIMKNTDGKIISGKDAFLLYDTYGFPFELTVEEAAEYGYSVCEEEFKQAMEEQKTRARNARKDISSFGSQNEEYLKFTTPSKFIGYDEFEVTTKVIKVFANGLVLEETPFYAFSGGQLSDRGTINDLEVYDVIKLPNGQTLHVMDVEGFKEGDEVHALIDVEYRNSITKNHSSAHILHKALKEVLGSHVNQQGSEMSYETCRFDFNNYQTLTNEELLKVEEIVNKNILEAHPVKTLLMNIEEAKQSGALALFDEKYGDVVRVVDMECAKELCGGTHVSNTQDINHFAIASFESIGSGIFRITATTGLDYMDKLKEFTKPLELEIEQLLNKKDRILESAKELNINLSFDFTRNLNEVGYRYVLAVRNDLALLKEQIKELDREFNAKKAQNALQDLSKYDNMIVGDKLIGAVSNIEVDILKQIVDALLNKLQTGLVFLADVIDSKVVFICKTNLEQYDAGKLVKEAAIITGGNGGGKKNLAQAGGKDISKVDLALERIKEVL